VLAAGAGSTATEIAASRLLAPYFGSSTVVWANVIGLVLAALSLGYWLGGRLADRRPEPRLLGGVVLLGLLLFTRLSRRLEWMSRWSLAIAPMIRRGSPSRWSRRSQI